jgi:hypothetical protein
MGVTGYENENGPDFRPDFDGINYRDAQIAHDKAMAWAWG